MEYRFTLSKLHDGVLVPGLGEPVQGESMDAWRRRLSRQSSDGSITSVSQHSNASEDSQESSVENDGHSEVQLSDVFSEKSSSSSSEDEEEEQLEDQLKVQTTDQLEDQPKIQMNDEVIDESSSGSSGEEDEEEEQPVDHCLGSGFGSEQQTTTEPLSPSRSESVGSSSEDSSEESSEDSTTVDIAPTISAGLKGTREDALRLQVTFLAGLEELTRESPVTLEEITGLMEDAADTPPRAGLCDVLKQENNLKELEELLSMAKVVREMAVSVLIVFVLVVVFVF